MHVIEIWFTNRIILRTDVKHTLACRHKWRLTRMHHTVYVWVFCARTQSNYATVDYILAIFGNNNQQCREKMCHQKPHKNSNINSDTAISGFGKESKDYPIVEKQSIKYRIRCIIVNALTDVMWYMCVWKWILVTWYDFNAIEFMH